MKVADIRTKTDEELKKEVLTLHKEGMNLRFEKVNGQLKDTASIRRNRRDIARVNTIIAERKLGLNVANDTKKGSVKKKTVTKKEKVSK